MLSNQAIHENKKRFLDKKKYNHLRNKRARKTK